MTRRDRRRQAAAQYLQSVRGQWFAGACYDCTATATVGMADDGGMCMHIFHSPTCPAARGIVPWRHVKRCEP